MNLKAKKQNGITMVALVVTIIVLIILASISIAVLTGDDGIINQGKEAKDETEINEEKQIIEISTVQAMERNIFGYVEEENLEKALNENIGKRDEKYKLEETPNGNFVVTIIESNREYTVVQDGEVLIGRQDPENQTPGGTGGSGEESGGGTTPDPTPEDTTPPTVTVQVTGKTSSYITIKVAATDDTAMPTTPKYTYYIKKSTDNSYIQKSTDNTSSTYTFGSLNPETSYDIQVQVADKAGNKGAGKIENVKTEALPKDETSPTVVVANTGTTSNSISVKVTATDDTAMPSTPTYVYYIKKSTEADTAYVQKASNASDTYTFSELTTNESYDIKVQVADQAGNIGEGLLTNITTSSIPDGNTDGTINFGEVIWDNRQASITISTSYTQYKIEYQKNGTTEGNWIEIANGGTVSGLLNNDQIYARLTDGVNAGNPKRIVITDGIAPTVTIEETGKTTNSISVKVTAVDNESGMPDQPKYTYYIKKATETDYVQKAENSNTTYTFTELNSNIDYDIKVIVTDIASNRGIATITSKTENIPNGTDVGAITFGDAIWSNKQASVTISTDTSYKIEYQKNATTEGNWTEIASGASVSGLLHNDTIYARLTDGINAGTAKETTIKDSVLPQLEISTNVIASNSISVKAQGTDNESGILETSGYTYYIKKSTQPETSYVEKASNTTSSYTFTGLDKITSYDIKVSVSDIAGNTNTKTLTNVSTIDIPAGTDIGAITFGSVSWNNKQASTTISTSYTQYKIEYQKNGTTEGNWTEIANGGTVSGLLHNDTIYARLTDGANVGEEASLTILDGIAPTVTVTKTGSTSNSITVEVAATDNESGMPTAATYTYYIKQSTEPDTSYVQKASGTNTTQTFSDLTAGLTYDIKVEVNDIAGNTGAGKLSVELTNSIPDGSSTGAINFGNVTWSDEQASVTISTDYTQYKIEYQKNSTTEGNWTEITSGASVSGLLHNDIVYARLTDGINHGAHTSKTIQDTTAPTASISLSKATSTTLAVQVNATDNESGIKEYAYYIKESTDSTGSYVLQGTSASPNFTFENLTKGTSYNIQVIVTDKAGNSKTATLTSQSTTSGISGTITFGEPKWTTTTSYTGSTVSVSVTISTTSSYTLQYQKNDTADTGWVDITSGGTVSSLSNGDTVYARLTDGTDSTTPVSKKIEDTTPPSVTVTATSTADTSVTVKATASDGETGLATTTSMMMKVAKYTFYIKEATASEYGTGTVVSTSYGNTGTASNTFSGLSAGTTYDIKVEISDKAGNVGTGTMQVTTTGSSGGGTGETTPTGTITFGTATWSGGKASVTISTDTSYTIQYQIGSTTGTWNTVANGGTVSGISHNQTIYARLTDGTNYGDVQEQTITDTVNPTATIEVTGTGSNTITIKVNAVDNESGVASYTYAIKASTGYMYTTKATDITNSTYTFSGLTEGTSYDIKVTVKDNAGRSGTATQTKITTTATPPTTITGTITFGTATWSGGKASVTVSTTSSYSLKYQKNSTTGTWTSITNGGSVTGLSHGDTLYAVLTDGTNMSDYSSVKITDSAAPSITITESTTTATVGNDLSFDVVLTDAESGISLSNCKYLFRSTGTKLSTTSTLWTSSGVTISSANGTITTQPSEAGTLYLHVLATDVAGNKVTAVSNAITVEEASTAGKYYDTETEIPIGDGTITVPGGSTISGIDGEFPDINLPSWDIGIVLYIIPKDEIITDWFADTNSNGIYDVQEKYDQFVWVPVPNAIAKDKNSDGTIDETDIDLMIADEEYPMAIATDATNYRGVLYDFTLTDGKVTVSDKAWSSTSTSYKEPSVVTSYDNSTYLPQVNGILNTSYSDSTSFGSALQTEFNAMVNKVANNKGFWVGRYETSGMSNSTTTTYASSNEIKVNVVKGTTNGIRSVTWYRMYAQQKIYSKLALGNTTTVTSSMIWGSQWDQIMIWMKGVKNTNKNSYYVINALTMGNYGTSDDSDTSTSAPAPTGYQEIYKVKNVYDLAGNVWDWTLEANDTDVRVLRGGNCTTTHSSVTRADYRGYNFPAYSDSSMHGSRSTLY